MKIHPVQVSLFLSTLSLFLFFGFSTAINEISDGYEKKIQEVRAEEGQAKLRLARVRDTITSLRSKRDSLEVIAEAERRPEILWTARALYSETKRAHEMRFVAWVIRNRYDVRHRGASSYRSVVLDHKQFSAFNRGSAKRGFYLSLEPKHSGQVPRWHTALATAKSVIDAPEEKRPFSLSTLFFYSQRSMDGQPHWESSMREVALGSVNSHRFRFLQKSNITGYDSHRSR